MIPRRITSTNNRDRLTVGPCCGEHQTQIEGERMTYIRLPIFFLCFSLLSCAGTQTIKFEATEVISESTYLQNKETNGVVLFDVNWGRYWGCGQYENAQLVSMAFDKLPMESLDNEAVPALVLHSPSRLFVDPVFLNYGFSLEPGEYAISAFSIKVARSVSQIYFPTTLRENLYKDGSPIGGTFTVEAGETVFIGNFYLDCTYEPILWRYYSENREAFEAHVSQYKSNFPFLEPNDIEFRLFKTNEFGHDFEL